MARRAFIDRYGDVLLAGVSAALFVLQVATGDGFAGERPQAVLVALLFSASLAWRRRQPRVPLVAGIGLMLCARLGLHELGNSGGVLRRLRVGHLRRRPPRRRARRGGQCGRGRCGAGGGRRRSVAAL